ncbi:MAG: membrane protein insertion efficiency factor YidD [Candidatus Cloacimonetes bacterium]|jgi:putative component of membrane protein insertase Oxa1/YidC/SpoIIIJ protein YidD|nr:membrane protein insertion efficiency factor YidD [Candidatus Cloacimonadota bacterium]
MSANKGLLFLLLLAAFSACLATAREDYQAVMQGWSGTVSPARERRDVIGEFGPVEQLKLVFYGALAVYQTFISSQNEPSCMFEPSCSEFTKEAFSKYGILGIIMGSDRIQRCNGMGHRYYDPADLRGGLISDPVEKYRF